VGPVAQCYKEWVGTTDRIVRDPIVPEPALQPLRQAAAAPATPTQEMASDSALPSNPDGLRPLVFPLFPLVVALGVVDLDLGVHITYL
jgi:hypothetical protein